MDTFFFFSSPQFWIGVLAVLSVGISLVSAVGIDPPTQTTASDGSYYI